MTQNRISAADLADTGQWRLIVYIHPQGLQAYLAEASQSSTPLARICDDKWEGDDETLLKNIESSVYDHPRLLDDFATDIIIATDQVMWAPADALDEEGSEDEIFTALFPNMEGEAIVDDNGAAVALFTPAKGLKSFLNRTFPGARLRHHLSIEQQAFTAMYNDATGIWLDITPRKADFILLRNGDFITAVSHSHNGADDIIYRCFQMAEVFGFDSEARTFHLSGDAELKAEVARKLESLGAAFEETALPVSDDLQLPTPVIVCASRSAVKANRNSRNENNQR